MGINFSAKGYRKMLEAQRIAEKQGYSVSKIRRGRGGKEDFFGCADLIISNESRMVLVGVTSRANISRVRKRMLAFTNHPVEIDKEIWYYDNKRNWKIETVEG